ncbi:hypothetical protein GCM10023213_20380 [Prosthecobacter algae]|uniref:Uncharacterized protein n=1 Tax=Prosthecobacter algae TaxID=1144682 RepID=A0ABP9P302_9BACT
MAQWQLREVIGLQRQGSQQAIADEGDGVFVGVAGVHLEGAIAGPHETVGAELVAEDPTKQTHFLEPLIDECEIS